MKNIFNKNLISNIMRLGAYSCSRIKHFAGNCRYIVFMAARVNQLGTSAISENKEMDFAVDTVIADISQQLVLDVPGSINPNRGIL